MLYRGPPKDHLAAIGYAGFVVNINISSILKMSPMFLTALLKDEPHL